MMWVLIVLMIVPEGFNYHILTSDVGPRVIRCGFVGGPNVFKEYAEELGGTGEGTCGH